MKSILRYIFLFFIGFLLLQSCSDKHHVSEVDSKVENDSIAIWIAASKNNSIPLKQRKQGLLKAQKEIESKPENVVSAKQLGTVAFRFAKLRDTTYFKKINDEVLRLGAKYQDSSILGVANWSCAEFHIYQEIYDKAYYYYDIAYKYFNGINQHHEAGRMLYAMAWIKRKHKDFTGSEVLAFKAIKKYKLINNSKRLRATYNFLGVLNTDMEEYDRAIFYLNKSYEFIPKLKNSIVYYSVFYNNIGYAYYRMGNYDLSVENLDKGINLYTDELSYDLNYIHLLENRGLSWLSEGNTSKAKKDLFRAFSVRDTIKETWDLSASKVFLSEYYTYVGDTLKALKFAKEANILAQTIKNGDDYLSSLKQMVVLDKKNSQKYLNRYIQFNDSLIDVERKAQNKFTRIEFETDEYIEETERLSEQKIWILSSGMGILVILSLLYFLRIQKSKTEKLRLEAQEQKANEQLYQLTIQQQNILEEEKVKERNRISEELHDGILGRLFGTRMGLGFFEIHGDQKEQEQHQAFLDELQEIEKEIRDVSHKLNTSFESSAINFSIIIEQLLKDKSVVGNFKYELKIEKNIAWKEMDQLTKVNIYRILQEALQNIIKHADAQFIIVDFSKQKSLLIITIKDDGKGIQNKKKKGIGMKNMHSRIQKLKGTLEVFSTIEQGTSLNIQIPI